MHIPFENTKPKNDREGQIKRRKSKRKKIKKEKQRREGEIKKKKIRIIFDDDNFSETIQNTAIYKTLHSRDYFDFM